MLHSVQNRLAVAALKWPAEPTYKLCDKNQLFFVLVESQFNPETLWSSLIHFFFNIFFKIFNERIIAYNIMLVSAIHHHESAIGIHTTPLS